MSVKVMDRVFALRLAPLDKLILLVLADAADPLGRNAFPSIDYIAATTGLGRRKVQGVLARHRTDARRRRLLVVEKVADPGRRLATTYAFDMELLRRLAAKNEARMEAARAAKRRSRGPAREKEGCTPCAPQMPPAENEGCTPCAPQIPETPAEGCTAERGGVHGGAFEGCTAVHPQPSLGTVLGTVATTTAARARDDVGWEAVCDLFDRVRVETFGIEQARPWRHATDRVMAERWLAAGATLELLEAVFRRGFDRAKRKRKRPFDALSALGNSVADAIGEVRSAADAGEGASAGAADAGGGYFATASDFERAFRDAYLAWTQGGKQGAAPDVETFRRDWEAQRGKGRQDGA